MKTNHAIAVLVGVLIAQATLGGQETPESSEKDYGEAKGGNDKETQRRSDQSDISDTSKAMRGEQEYGEGKGEAESSAQEDDEGAYRFYDLKGDKATYPNDKYYDPRQYGTPSGYINPNYRFPDREDVREGQAVDEAMKKHIIDGSKTMEEVLKLYHPEQRDVFWKMDQVAYPPDHEKAGELHLLSLDKRAVMGRNTWMMWCGGNQWFWDWLASDGFGLLDFLHLLDSRERDQRFAKAGLWNQPGMSKDTEPGPWGLYLDEVDEPLTDRSGEPLDTSQYRPLGNGDNPVHSDGVDPRVYGYPSGVIGFRLFPNPEFDKEAKARWDAEAFYEDPDYRSNPELVRPVRVGMSCALCHVAAHPLNPPEDPADPEWENLSAIIGNQNFRTSEILGGQAHPSNFLNHFLAAQQPGTVDTSMTSTDWIANANAMNPVFEFQARMNRASKNPAEVPPERGAELPAPFGGGKNPRTFPRVLMDGADSVGAWGALARVYLNIGLFGKQWNKVQNTILGFAPRRPFRLDTLHNNSVYWNVNEAFRIHYLASYFNHRIVKDESGQVRLSKPDEVHNEDHQLIESSTQGMRLKDALVPVDSDGKAIWDEDGRQHYPVKNAADRARFGETDVGKDLFNDRRDEIEQGKAVFTEHCMVCHSSRQPAGYSLSFQKEAPGGEGWENVPASDDGGLVIPLSHKNWEAFKESPSYQSYLKRARKLVNRYEDFFTDENFLSNDLRIPVSLVGSNSQRAMAENALHGEVWHDFSSKTYKDLPPVGEIEYYNPSTGETNTFQPDGNGRGYYRPPSLVSVWATAPLLHNNALGLYIPDHQAAYRVSVEGRLEMFDDAIRKLLWKEKRGMTPSGEGGLRNPGDSTWRGEDPSWIYRTDTETAFKIEAPQIRGAIERLVGHQRGLRKALGVTALFLIEHFWILPLLLAAIVVVLAWKARRWAAYLAILAGTLVMLALYVSGLNYLLPVWPLLLGLVLVAAGIVSIVGAKYPLKSGSQEGEEKEAKEKERESHWAAAADRKIRQSWAGMAAPIALWALCLVLVSGLGFVNLKLNGKAGPLVLGPFPKGTPVSAFMNQDPDAPVVDLSAAYRGLFRSFGAIKSRPDISDREALALFNRYAVPGLLEISKCPDWEMDRGHYFGEHLEDKEKEQLIRFLKTL